MNNFILSESDSTHLQEYLPEYAVCFFSEDCREDDGDTIRRWLNINRLLITVIYLHQLSVTTAGRVQSFLCSESQLEGGRQHIPFEERDRFDESVPSLCEIRVTMLRHND
jgi:hypothetical protein